MGSTSKFLLLLVVCIVFEEVRAWPNMLSFKSIDRDFYKMVNDAEKDVQKDMANTKKKILKEGSKIIKKAKGNPNVADCVMTVQQETLSNLDELSMTAMTCIGEVREEIKSFDEDGNDMRALMAMKYELKRRAKGCRDEARMNFKADQNEFSQNSKTCLLEPNFAPAM